MLVETIETGMASGPLRIGQPGQEGREFLGLLLESGIGTVERRYERGELVFGKGEPANALYAVAEEAVSSAGHTPKARRPPWCC